MKISKSQAHYVRAVYELSNKCDGVRVCDVAQMLSLSKASVSLAMTRLARQGFIQKDIHRRIFLTKNGEYAAVRMLDRYEIIRQFLTEILGVEKETAQQDACAMEHVISMDTLCAMCRSTGERNRRANHCPMMLEKRHNDAKNLI